MQRNWIDYNTMKFSVIFDINFNNNHEKLTLTFGHPPSSLDRICQIPALIKHPLPPSPFVRKSFKKERCLVDIYSY